MQFVEVVLMVIWGGYELLLLMDFWRVSHACEEGSIAGWMER